MRVIKAGENGVVGPRLDALTRFVAAAQDRLPAGSLDPALDVLRRAADRFTLSAEHTVVVLAGATGVGKSSLFNALVGIGLSPVAIRRPTTTAAIACVWEADRLAEAKPLLDRLGVDERRQLGRDSALDRSAARDAMAGLVLVDLPDHDSAVRDHQVAVDVAVGLADVLIWVTDPQKYADASWHDRYIKALSNHGEVMLIVLNQIDRLPPDAVSECVADLTRLVEQDGLSAPRVLAVSARTRSGLDELRRELADRVSGRRSVAERLAADVDRVAERLAPLLAPVSGADAGSAAEGARGAALISDSLRAEVMEGLRAAAAVASLAEMVTGLVFARSRGAVSSPVRTLFARRRRGGSGGGGATVRPGAAETSARSHGASYGGTGVTAVRAVRDLIRSSFAADSAVDAPGTVPVDRAALETVLARLADAAVASLPQAWGQAVRKQILDSRRALADRLDSALSACRLYTPTRSVSRSAVRAAHIVLLLVAAGAIAVSFLPGAWRWIGPVSALLALAGESVLDVVARADARKRANTAGRVAVGQLSIELAAVAQDVLFEPIEAELERYRGACADFELLRGQPTA